MLESIDAPALEKSDSTETCTIKTPDDSCDLNPEFAVICSFIARFGDQLDLELNIEQLKSSIEDQSQLDGYLIDLHVKLLKKVRRYFVKDQWEKVLIRFASEYSYEDAYEIEQLGYLKARTSNKLQLLSRLLDAQFLCDQKFKNSVNLIEADQLRVSPLGRDIHGNNYWHRSDKEGNLRVFLEEPLDYKSWKTVCSNAEQLEQLITKLDDCKEEKVKGEPILEPYNPLPQIFPEYFQNKIDEKEIKREEEQQQQETKNDQKVAKGRNKARAKKSNQLSALVEAEEEEVHEKNNNHLINQNGVNDQCKNENRRSSCSSMICSSLSTFFKSPISSVEYHVANILDSLVDKVATSIGFVARPLSRNASEPQNENSIKPSSDESSIKTPPKPQKKRAPKREKSQEEVLPRRTSSRIQQLQQKKVAEQEEEMKRLIESNANKKSNSTAVSMDEDSRSQSISSRNNNSSNNKRRSESPENRKTKDGKRRRKEKGQSWRRGKGKKKLSWDKDDSDLSGTSSVTESEKSELEDLDETLQYDENYDDEFACEDEDTNNEPVIIKRARTARQSILVPGEQLDQTNNTVVEEDKPCGRCDKSNDPEWILLCDMCDDGYHTSCCLPPLMIVPDGDWYCPSCEHKFLLIRLRDTLSSIKQILEAKEREMMKNQRLRQKTVKPKKVDPPIKVEYPNDEIDEITDAVKPVTTRTRPMKSEPRAKKAYMDEYSDDDEEEEEFVDDDDDEDYMDEYKDDETEEEVEEEEEKLPEKRRRKVINRLNDPLDLMDLDSTDAESVKSSKPDSDESFKASASEEEEEEEEEEDLSETEVSDASTSLDELIASHVKKKKKMKRIDMESRTRRAASMRVSYKESTDEEDEDGGRTSPVSAGSPDRFEIDEDDDNDEDDDRSTSISNRSFEGDEPPLAPPTVTKNVGEPIIMRFNTSYVDIHSPPPTTATELSPNAHPSFYEDES